MWRVDYTFVATVEGGSSGVDVAVADVEAYLRSRACTSALLSHNRLLRGSYPGIVSAFKFRRTEC